MHATLEVDIGMSTNGSETQSPWQVEPIEDFETSTMDVRDFIFVVVEQLSFLERWSHGWVRG